jgi:hypothetical protein
MIGRILRTQKSPLRAGTDRSSDPTARLGGGHNESGHRRAQLLTPGPLCRNDFGPSWLSVATAEAREEDFLGQIRGLFRGVPVVTIRSCPSLRLSLARPSGKSPAMRATTAAPTPSTKLLPSSASLGRRPTSVFGAARSPRAGLAAASSSSVTSWIVCSTPSRQPRRSDVSRSKPRQSVVPGLSTAHRGCPAPEWGLPSRAASSTALGALVSGGRTPRPAPQIRLPDEAGAGHAPSCDVRACESPRDGTASSRAVPTPTSRSSMPRGGVPFNAAGRG